MARPQQINDSSYQLALKLRDQIDVVFDQVNAVVSTIQTSKETATTAATTSTAASKLAQSVLVQAQTTLAEAQNAINVANAAILSLAQAQNIQLIAQQSATSAVNSAAAAANASAAANTSATTASAAATAATNLANHFTNLIGAPGGVLALDANGLVALSSLPLRWDQAFKALEQQYPGAIESIDAAVSADPSSLVNIAYRHENFVVIGGLLDTLVQSTLNLTPNQALSIYQNAAGLSSTGLTTNNQTLSMSQIVAAFSSFIANLPTVMPVQPGLPWLNGQFIQVS